MPGDLPLEAAHEIAEAVEREILEAVPEARKVQSHLEPLSEVAAGEEVAIDETAVARAVEDETGAPPRATCASCGRTTASSRSSRSPSADRSPSPTPTAARAPSKSACAGPCPRSPTSSSTRNREALHVPPRRAPHGARVGRPDRGRPRRASRRADPAGVLHRRRVGARARGYPLAGVRLLAPVLHPPAVRVFSSETSFEFANPAAIVDPDGGVTARSSRNGLTVTARLAVIGTDGAIAGFTMAADWRDPSLPPPKYRDFALGVGPLVVTPEEVLPGELQAIVRVGGDERLLGKLDSFDWGEARDLAAEGTALYAGDLLVGPAAGSVDGLGPDVTLTPRGSG